MSTIPFHHPVSFRLGKGRVVVVRSVQEALDFLDNRWPEVGDDLYIAARSACLEALMDPGKAKAARYAFIDALGEAGLEPAFEFGFMAAMANSSRHRMSS
ncbi:DUF982 domain-containing protein [Labrys okinawensis]|uniref:DUF982 domain-containing protein n=1 Tax=Labrys okinawensis TaxID=346911 RepID=A0A2S9QIG6_9HYPH|nr:DUF982 domain-containing protein [Labrys okinawensis]PRH89151.1 DUF982 domain-containing protein [Labrys okinawensis]